MLWLCLEVIARAWSPTAGQPVALGAAVALGLSPGERPLVLAGSAQGLAAVDPRSGSVAWRIEGDVRAIWTGDLDLDGAEEIVLCERSGISLLSLDGLGAPLREPLTEIPCDALTSASTAEGRALIAAEGAELSLLSRGPSGITRSLLPVAPQPPPRIAASGFAVAAVDESGALKRILGPMVSAIAPAPVLAAVGLPSDGEPDLAILYGEPPELLTSRGLLPVEGGATGLLTDGRGVWLLDAAALRFGIVEEGAAGLSVRWFPSPFAPRTALAADLDGDGCADLLLSDKISEGTLVKGSCEVPPPLPPLPQAPETLALGGPWPLLHARVGEPLSLQVVDAQTGWSRFTSRGGPPGFAVRPDGRIDFVPSPDDVGRWRVSVRSTLDGVVGHWIGFQLAVWPGEASDAEIAPAPPQEIPGEGAAQPSFSVLVPKRCLLGMGIAGGASRSRGDLWQRKERSDVRGGLSPLASLACGFGGSRLHLVAGLDSAPYFRYGDRPRDREHILAASGGVDLLFGTTSLGLLGSVGATSRGIGARLTWLGLKDWKEDPMGIELRGLWLAPKVGAELSAAFVWTL